MNRFTTADPAPVMANPNFAALEAAQCAAVTASRAGRDGAAVAEGLARLERVAAAEGPLMPQILESVRMRATLGEISDALRRVWGVYHA